MATPDDAAAITVVQVRAWRRAYADILPPEAVEPEAVAERRERWAGRLRASDAPTLVFDLHGQVAGFASVGPARDADVRGEDGELRALYVDPPAQGAGVGRALMDAAEARLRADGYGRAVLWVFADNGLARDFYERRGWALEPEAVIAAHHGADWWAPAVRYRRAL